MEEPLQITEEELRRGFTVQTLTYTDRFELPLGNNGRRLERAVAIVVDDHSRLKRRAVGHGYVHERLVEQGWDVVEAFADLAALLESAIYRRHLSLAEPAEPPPHEGIEDEP